MRKGVGRRISWWRVMARRFAALQKIAPARIISITALEKRDLVEEP